MKPITISTLKADKLALFRGIPTISYLRTELDEELLAYLGIFKNNDNDSEKSLRVMNKHIANKSLRFKTPKTNLAPSYGREGWLDKFN